MGATCSTRMPSPLVSYATCDKRQVEVLSATLISRVPQNDQAGHLNDWLLAAAEMQRRQRRQLCHAYRAFAAFASVPTDLGKREGQRAAIGIIAVRLVGGGGLERVLRPA